MFFVNLKHNTINRVINDFVSMKADPIEIT